MIKNILITGTPGVGKTTLVKRVVDWAKTEKGLQLRGFYTSELREQGERKGFEIITTDNRRGVLAHRKIRSPYRVGKYGVDVLAFEKIVLPLFEISEAEDKNILLIIDEIGKMECFSDKFVETVRHILNSKNPVVATVANKGTGFIAEVKQRADVRLFTITLNNRERLFHSIVEFIEAMIKR
ncbi:NTPase [Candidatus Sumerlaeota bacterium]|nr:NTPase [Candidatus Sumerlaeota bacterium]